MRTAPGQPALARCDELLLLLAAWIARDGAAGLLAVPVEPGRDAFPDPFEASAAGIRTLLRRLAWHAGVGLDARTVTVRDERAGAPPTSRRPETTIEVTAIRRRELCATLGLIGEDDVLGTAAHELGVAYAAIVRSDPTDPYRAAELLEIAIEPDRDLEAGSLATVYLGLGVLAVNAAFQQYSRPGRFNGAYSPLEYDVIRAGYAPMSELAYLLAVQALIRGEPAPPAGLLPPQRDEVSAWLAALAGQGTAICERLGIAGAPRSEPRLRAEPFTDHDALPVPPASPHAARAGFRWHGHRGGAGMIAGMVFGGVTAIAALHYLPVFVVAGAGLGQVAGRRAQVTRCSLCAETVPRGASACASCGAVLRGDIRRLRDRLDAEEALEAAERSQAEPVAPTPEVR